MPLRISGPLEAADLGGSRWRLVTSDGACTVYLHGVDAKAAASLASGRIDSVSIEWIDGAVQVRPGKPAAPLLRARGAIVHRPVPAAFDALPSAAFDHDARRFWRRVFALMRIPGGRHLLKWLTRPAARKP